MIHTLALISLVLLAAFALAASSLSQLNLSSRYAQRTQADYTARAAMTEFVVRARTLSGKHDVTSPPDPIFPKFVGHEVLLQNQPRVDGKVTLLLDKCVDNSGGSLPTRSAFDPPGKASVPPYCLSVAYEVVMGARRYTYESLVQQRWPYALVAPGPVLVPGRVGPSPTGDPDPTSLPQKFWSAPSEVKGRVLGLETDITSDVDSHQSGETRLGNLINPIKISMGAYEALYPYAYSGGLTDAVTSVYGGGPTSTVLEDSASRLIVGGGYKVTTLSYSGEPVDKDFGFTGSIVKGGGTGPNATTDVAPAVPGVRGGPPEGLQGSVGGGTDRNQAQILSTDIKRGGVKGWSMQTVFVNTKGAIVHRGVDLVQNQPSNGDGFTTNQVVTVKEGNTLNGRARYDYWLNGENPADAPSREKMRELFTKPDTTGWGVSAFPRAKEIIIGKGPAPDPLVSTSGSSTPPTYLRAESGKLRINGSVDPAGYDPDTSAGALYAKAMAEYYGLPVSYGVQGSLSLQDVALAVEGNLTLSNYVLKGSRATIIVDGTLTLDGGYLDAGDNGLVIFCRRLIMKAQGNFNGLIVAEKGAAIYGAGAASPPAAPGLIIKGGLLIGGTDLQVIGDPTLTDSNPPSGMLAGMRPLQMRGLMLSSCKLEYAPQYMRGLNNFGNYEVLATELRQ